MTTATHSSQKQSLWSYYCTLAIYFGELIKITLEFFLVAPILREHNTDAFIFDR
jgi:hypothetical protein